MKKTIVITGANGFLGSNLVHRLSQDNNVIAISRSNYNIRDCNVNFISTSMNEYHSLVDVINEYSPDFIIHFAWDGGNTYKLINSLDQYENVTNSSILLEALNKTKSHFIGLGAGAEYGSFKNCFSEQDLENPISNYGRSKFLFKEISKNYCASKDIKWTWIRPFYTYGPRDVETRLIPRIIKSCLLDEKLELDSCDSYSDYLYVDDFMKMMIFIIQNELQGVYNLCSGKPQNIRSLVEKVISNFPNNQVTFDKENDRKNFCHNVSGNNEKIQKLMDLSLTPIDDGISKTIKYYKEKFIK
jgi:nucleoside-diphosphate-sugar epimerase